MLGVKEFATQFLDRYLQPGIGFAQLRTAEVSVLVGLNDRGFPQ